MKAENSTDPAKPIAMIKKREQIRSGNKALFLWVAGASIIVAFSVVASIFLVKQLIFNEKILIEQANSLSGLEKSIDNAKALDKNIAILRSDRHLASARAAETENNLDVVIDALPYDGDPVNLGASLQNVLFKDIDVDGLAVNSASASTEAAVGADGAQVVAAEPIGASLPLNFSFKVTGTQEDIKKLLDRLNASIRPIKIVSAKIESGGDKKITLSATAETYYQPKKAFELTEKTVKP